MQTMRWTCANCEREPGKLEKACEWQGNIVCQECYDKLARGSVRSAPPAVPSSRSKPKPNSAVPNAYALVMIGGFVLGLLGLMMGGSSGQPGFGTLLAGLGFVVFAIMISFLPYAIARGKGHPNATAIGVLCLFSWSGIVWVVALVWAVMNTNRERA